METNGKIGKMEYKFGIGIHFAKIFFTVWIYVLVLESLTHK